MLQLVHIQSECALAATSLDYVLRVHMNEIYTVLKNVMHNAPVLWCISLAFPHVLDPLGLGWDAMHGKCLRGKRTLGLVHYPIVLYYQCCLLPRALVEHTSLCSANLN